MTPGNPGASRVHPARRDFVGIAVGISKVPVRGQVEARVAVYASRTSAQPLVELTVAYPEAGAFKPTLGTRYRLTLEPVE